MDIKIQEKVCTAQKLSTYEVLVSCVATMGNYQETLKNLYNREILVAKEGKYYLTPHWKDVIEGIICDSTVKFSEEELADLATKMMECFPKGKMPGTPYYYRCNKREIQLKLKKFFVTHGKYSEEAIIDACKRYVASFNGNYRYLPLLKYFILKNKMVMDEEGKNHSVEYSPLADYLENKEDSNVSNNDEDWMFVSRN